MLIKVVLTLTDGAVFPFKARYAGTSVVVHSVNTYSIVFTRAEITVINIWSGTKKKILNVINLHYHRNWKPINFFKIQWNLAWRQPTPPAHPPVQTVGEGEEGSAKEGRPSHTASICPGQTFSGVEITNRFAPTKIVKKAFSLVTLLFTLHHQYSINIKYSY